MLDFFSSPYLLLFARLTVGGVLLIGALGKLLDPDNSRNALAEASFLPVALARPAAMVLPWIEGLVGLLLLLGLALWPASLAAAALMLLFTVVVGIDLAQNRRKSCHCFGRFSSEPLGRFTLLRNLFLLGLALLLVLRPTPYVALDNVFTGSGAGLPSPVDAIPVAFLAMLAVLLIVIGGTVVSTIRSFLRAF